MTDEEVIRRQVDWFYRATIKQPRDTIAALAQEYGESEAVIQAGIVEATTTLDQVQPALDAGLIARDAHGVGFVVTAKGRRWPKN